MYDGGFGDASASSHEPIPGESPRRFVYQRALDGVRGLAVALVVLFHLDIGVVTGGYLGVSVFFTLSGFLITALLLERYHDTGGLDLADFYVRRIKRLVPASALTLLAIALVTAGGGFTASERSIGDLVAAGLNVFNWREVVSGRSYADLFAGDSPVAHFWSLAIEEQFYAVWPLALLVLLRSQRIGPARLLTAVTALFLASAFNAQLGTSSAVYFASWTRAAEILAGAWLAVWLTRADDIPRWWRHLSGPALVVIVVSSLVTPSTTGWAYAGGLPLFSVVSVALIAGLQVPGRTRVALSIGPLVGLGRISYGVYLVHWPVFVFFDENRMGVDGASLVFTRLAVTALISLAIYALIERPIRTSVHPMSIRRALVMAVSTSVGLVSATHALIDRPQIAVAGPPVLATPDPAINDGPVLQRRTLAVTPRTDPAVDVAEPAEDTTVESIEAPSDTTDEIVSVDSEPSAFPASEQPDAVLATETTTIAVFGDSVPAWLMRDAASSFARQDVVLVNGANEACDGAVALPLGRDRRNTELRPPADCLEWTTSYPDTLASHDDPIDVGLLVIGQAITVDRLVDDSWIHPCESSTWYLDDVRNRIAFLRDAGVEPVLALPARFGERVTFILPDDHEERMACVRSALLALAVEQQISTVDLDGVLCVDGDCEALRSRDGIHVDQDVAGDVLDELVDLTLDAR